MKSWKKVFGIIWTGQFFSLLSSSIVNFAIIIWISLQTESATMLAFAAIAGLMPQMILSPFSGVLIDRWNRKKIMIIADGFIALYSLMLAILFLFKAVEVWHIFTVLGLRSIGSTFHMPAMQASVPLLAPKEQMIRIAGINQIINSASTIAAPALAVLFISMWNMEYVLMLDIIGALIAIISLLLINIPNPERERTSQKNMIFKEMKEGILAVSQNKGLSWVFVFFFLSCMIYQPVNTLFPLLTIQHFNGNEYHISTIQVMWAVGSFISGIIMGSKIYNINRVILINLMYFTMGIIFFLMGTLPSSAFIIYAVLACLGGISASVFLSTGTSVIQTHVEPSALGRVFSMFYTLSIFPTLISLLLTGFFADMIGTTVSFIIFGILMVMIGVLSFMASSSLKLDKKKD